MDKINSYILLNNKEYEKYNIYISCFLAGVFLYDTFSILFGLYQILNFRIIQIAGLILWNYSLFKLIIAFPKSTKVKKRLIFLLIWNLFIVLRFNELNFNELRNVLFLPFHFFSYLVPLVLLIPISPVLFKKIFNFGLLTSIVFGFISYSLFPLINLTDLVVSTYIPASLYLFINWRYNSKWKILLSLIAILLAIYLGMIAGRRTIILINLLILFIGWFTYIFSNSISNVKIKIPFILIIIFVVSVLYLNIDTKELLDNFEVLSERLYVNSREDIFAAFYKDFNTVDWIIGKGIDGTYYNPINYWDFSGEESREVEYRDLVENGYLFFILKGGVIHLFLFLFLAIPSMFLGFFKSNNGISKSSSFITMIFLIEMFSFGIPSFSIKYIFVWLCISFNFSKNLRKTPEVVMQGLIE